MKRILVPSLGMVVSFFLGMTLQESNQSAAAVAEASATKNGDTNGDGRIDISDAVYLLNFLFSGGSEIAEIQCPITPPKSILLSTGQEMCVGSAGYVDSSIQKARGQDASYGLGCPLEGRFVDNGDGTVSDNCTGFMWTKKRVDVDGDGELTTLDAKPWLEACQIAHDMTYMGHSDWRIPNVNELLSVMNFGTNDGNFRDRLYSVFQVEGSIEPGTWTSTPIVPRFAFAHILSSWGGSCECCALTRVDMNGAHPFMAVRGL